MTEKTRYEETPAIELPKLLHPVKVSEALPKDVYDKKANQSRYYWCITMSGNNTIACFDHTNKGWVDAITDEPVEHISYWYSENPPTSESLEEAAEKFYAEKTKFIMRVQTDESEDIMLYQEQIINMMVEFSQQQQQGQVINDAEEINEPLLWERYCKYCKENSLQKNKLVYGGVIIGAKLFNQPTQGNETRELVEALKMILALQDDDYWKVNHVNTIARINYIATEALKKHTTTSKEEGK